MMKNQRSFKVPPVTSNMTDLDVYEYDWWWSRINMTLWLATPWQNTTVGGGFVAPTRITH